MVGADGLGLRAAHQRRRNPARQADPQRAAGAGKEQRALDKKLAEARAKRAAAPPLSEREKEHSESLFVEGVKYVLLEDYTKALEQLLKAYHSTPTMRPSTTR
ncbi:hypothetical protein ACFQT0_04970 [Hymenobacter humi]|uniref:Uncharacterized protein n=1 Tax=Hymenobacter humi TaxID=1411620 RepID=A0ABW2U0J7_9BACT